MIEWWNSLDVMMKVLWTITLTSSLVFVIQTIMTFLGADTDGDFDTGVDVDVDVDADADANEMGTGTSLLTFRNFVNFFLGFGWTAVLLHDQIRSTGLLMLVSIIVGVILVALVMLLFKWLGSMQQSGNINLFESAVDCQGSVYLTIPGERAGTGKVQISINDSVREYSALTDGPALRTGTRVRVVDVVNASTVLVEEVTSIIT